MPPRCTAFCHDLRDTFMYSKKIYTSFRNRKPTSWSEAGHTGEAAARLSLGYIQQCGVREWLHWKAAEASGRQSRPPRGRASQHLKAEAESGIRDALQAPWQLPGRR